MTTTVPSADRRGETAGARSPTSTYLAVLFVVYLVLLAWIVLWKLEVPYVGEGALRQIKLVPFVPSGQYGASAPSEVVANILLFVPFGVYLGVLAPSWRWWKAAAAIAGASLALEAAQYFLSVGSTDITDLIANTAGGLAGLGLLALTRRRLAARTITVVARICAVGTVLALLAAGAFVASPLHHSPPRDVIVVSPESQPGGQRTR